MDTALAAEHARNVLVLLRMQIDHTRFTISRRWRYGDGRYKFTSSLVDDEHRDGWLVRKIINTIRHQVEDEEVETILLPRIFGIRADNVAADLIELRRVADQRK